VVAVVLVADSLMTGHRSDAKHPRGVARVRTGGTARRGLGMNLPGKDPRGPRLF